MIVAAATVACGATAVVCAFLAGSTRRAKFVAVLMFLACIPLASDSMRLLCAAALVVASIMLSVGLGRRRDTESDHALYRSLGGLAMAAMLTAGAYGATGATREIHRHGDGPLSFLVTIACVSYLVWTVILLQSRHTAVRSRRVEMGAMGGMFAFELLAMAGMPLP